MYAVYRHLTTATIEQVLSDIAAIITNETLVSNLSASCDKPNTSLTNTSTSKWVLHDASIAGTRCFKKAMSYDAGVFVYVALNWTGTSMTLRMYTDWTVGVGGAGYGTIGGAYTVPANTVLSTYYISARDEGLLISNSANATQAPLLACEFTVEDPWRTAGNGCLPVICCSGATQAATTISTAAAVAAATTWAATNPFVTRSLTAQATWAAAGTAGSNLAIGCAQGLGGASIAYDSAGMQAYGLRSLRTFGAVTQCAFALGGDMSSKYPLYALSANLSGLYNDSLTFGADEYRVVCPTAGSKLAVKFG